jgi:hypothetical protein
MDSLPSSFKIGMENTAPSVEGIIPFLAPLAELVIGFTPE